MRTDPTEATSTRCIEEAFAVRARSARRTQQPPGGVEAKQLSRPPRSPIPLCGVGSGVGSAVGSSGARANDVSLDTATDPFLEIIEQLTPRRMEILRLVARGLTNREIGGVLHISAYTVKAHMAALFAILDVTNRTEAAIALQHYEMSRHEGMGAANA